MKVKFDLVRIGGIRKKYASEIILKQNVDLLRTEIRHLLKDGKCSHKDNTVHMTMIIPGKGYSIKINLQDIKDFHIRKELREKFPDSIYKGKHSTIMDNINNRIF